MRNPLANLSPEQVAAVLDIITALSPDANRTTVADAVYKEIARVKVRADELDHWYGVAEDAAMSTGLGVDPRVLEAIVEAFFPETTPEEEVATARDAVRDAEMALAYAQQTVVDAQNNLMDASKKSVEELAELDRQLGFNPDDGELVGREWGKSMTLPEPLPGWEPEEETPAVQYNGEYEPEQLITGISDPEHLQALAVDDVTQVIEIGPETAARLKKAAEDTTGDVDFDTHYQDEVLERSEQKRSSPTFGVDKTPWTKPDTTSK